VPADQFRQLFTKQVNIEDWLGKVQVQIGQASSPFLGVSSETLVGVSDTGVQVADFVVVHVR
jgi:hypothetical protein